MRRSRLFHWMRGTVLAASPLLLGPGCGGGLPQDCGFSTTVDLTTEELRAYADARATLEKADCAKLCATGPLDPIDEDVDACSKVDADTILCKYESWQTGGCAVEGRRTEGLAEPHPRGVDVVGAALARAAYFEAASVPAFTRLHEELARFGAPAALLDRTLAARDDELRHAAAARTLARAHGGVVGEPQLAPVTARTAVEVAIENVVEGCLGEAWAALVACWQAEHAPHADLRAAYARIAEEEASHAELSNDVAAFLDAHLDASDRARVEAAHRAAITDLLGRASAPVAPALVQHLGLPDTAAATRLALALALAPAPAPAAERVA